MSGDSQELDGLFHTSPDATPDRLHIRVAPGQSEETWREVARLAFHTPGGIAEISSETMTPEEAAASKALATYAFYPVKSD